MLPSIDWAIKIMNDPEEELNSVNSRRQMERREAARKFDFERTAELRDTIKELREKEFLFG
jgi:excinuclease ABC subunit B